MTNKHKLSCRLASLEEILALREAVLIRGTGRAPEFDGDRVSETQHWAAVTVEGQVVGCLTWMLNQFEGEPAWQLRGMAVAPEWRGRGVGRNLLKASEDALREANSVTRAWCNARIDAVGFYERLGWTAVSEPFMIENVCMHMKMKKDLEK